MGNGNHLLIQKCIPAIGNFDSYSAANDQIIGRRLRFVFRNIRPLLCSFDQASPTLVIMSDWFLMMIFRGCCGLSLPEKEEDHLVGTLGCRPCLPPTHSVAIFTSYSRSKDNRRERSPQPLDRWEKLNFDGVHPLVNRAIVKQPAFGVHRSRNTKVMELGYQFLTKEK